MDADGARAELFPHGRIPFRLRIGAVGHRALDERDARLRAAVAGQVARVAGLLEGTDRTPVRLAVVTALAEGGDRIVARAVREHEQTAQIEVVLPLADDDYAEAQGFADDPDRLRAFRELVAQASSKRVLSGPWTKDDAEVGYEAAAQYVVRRCDVLIALWDGKAQRGRGGTAPTLLQAAELGKPCIWVPSEGGEPWLDNLAPGSAGAFLERVRARVEGSLGTGPAGPLEETGLPYDVLAPLRQSFRLLDGFNARFVSPAAMVRTTSVAGWAAAPYARAGALARRFLRSYLALTWFMAACAIGAAVALGVELGFDPQSLVPAILEIACIVGAVTAFAVVKVARFHQRWLSCRLLAERLRTAGFVAPTGFDSVGSADLQAVFVDQSATEWSIRAFEEVWSARPRPDDASARAELPEADRIDLQHVLADRWIQGQIDYHRASGEKHERYGRRLTFVILLLLAGTIAFPILHATETATDWAVLCSIALPIAGGSLGAILTVRQHHALAERYRRMRGDLIVVQKGILDAKTTQQLREAASEAARVVMSEAGDWFGAMWFLDVDHPG